MKKYITDDNLKISNEDPDQTTYYLEKKKAAILSNSIVGIYPELSEIKVEIKKKDFPGFILEKHLYDGLTKLCNLQ